MIRKIIMAAFLFCMAGLAGAQEWRPVDYSTWQSTEIESLYHMRIGGELANYRDVQGDWHAIQNDFTMLGDTMAYNWQDLIRTEVRPNGTSVMRLLWKGVEYKVTQKLKKLIWLKTDTWDWVNVVDSVTWTAPSVDSNIVKWTNVFPAVDYGIRKASATVEHGIFFKPAFLDSAVTLYDQRPDSLTIALGNVMEYELTNVDDADSAIGTVERRILKDLGRLVFKITKQNLRFPGWDVPGTPLVPVKRRWMRKEGKLYCVEYVMMRWIKAAHEANPGATIWHNDAVQVTGTTNVEDATLISGWPDENFGGAAYVGTRYQAWTYVGLIRVQNLSSILPANAVITAAACSAYNYDGYAGTTVGIHPPFKPWVEGDEDGVDDDDGDVTWNDWTSDANEWTTEGCLCVGDDGVDNNADNQGCTSGRRDRMSTAMDTWDATGSGEWASWAIDTALANAWYKGDRNEEGLALVAQDEFHVYFRSSEYGSGNNPRFSFSYYTSPGSYTFKGTDLCDEAAITRNNPKYNLGDQQGGIPAKHYIQIGTYDYTSGDWNRGLIKFPTYEDTIPPGVQIDSAFLRLNYYTHDADADEQASENLFCYMMLDDWNEGASNGAAAQGECSWFYKYEPYDDDDSLCASATDSCWAVMGADSVEVDRSFFYSDSVQIDSGTYGYYRLDVTEDVRRHYAATATNYGWLLLKGGEDTDNIRWQFWSSEEGSSLVAPELVVYWSTPPIPAGANDVWYVRTGGSDAANGQTPETAWATIQEAIDRDLDGGDTVIIGGGDYNEVLSGFNKDWYGCLVFKGDYLGARTGDAGEIKVGRLNAWYTPTRGDMHFDHVRFDDWSGDYWIGTFAVYKDDDSRVKLTNCVFDGPINIVEPLYVEIVNCFIEDNQGEGFYASVRIATQGRIIVDNNTIGMETDAHSTGNDTLEFALWIEHAGSNLVYARNNLFPTHSGSTPDAYVGMRTNDAIVHWNYNSFDDDNAGPIGYYGWGPANWNKMESLSDLQTYCDPCDDSGQVAEADVSGDKYHLLATSEAIDAGYAVDFSVSVGGQPDYTYYPDTSDIDEDDRGSSDWDMGCDEYVAAPGGNPRRKKILQMLRGEAEDADSLRSYVFRGRAHIHELRKPLLWRKERP